MPTATAGLDGIDHAARDLAGRLVLPSAKNRPSGALEVLISVMIALPILTDFRSPVLLVGPGHRVVLRAPVPEATVDEDRDLVPRENQVGPSVQ